jgi:hypothetical protein
MLHHEHTDMKGGERTFAASQHCFLRMNKDEAATAAIAFVAGVLGCPERCAF